MGVVVVVVTIVKTIVRLLLLSTVYLIQLPCIFLLVVCFNSLSSSLIYCIIIIIRLLVNFSFIILLKYQTVFPCTPEILYLYKICNVLFI